MGGGRFDNPEFMRFRFSDDMAKKIGEILLAVNPQAKIENALYLAARSADSYKLSWSKLQEASPAIVRARNMGRLHRALETIEMICADIDLQGREDIARYLGRLPAGDWLSYGKDRFLHFLGEVFEMKDAAESAEQAASQRVKVGHPQENPALSVLSNDLARIFELITDKRFRGASRNRTSEERFLRLVMCDALGIEIDGPSFDNLMRAAGAALRRGRVSSATN